MKQTRRKELKTNVLSVYLQQIYEAVVQNATYLVGGLVVILAVLVIGLLVQRNRHRAEQAAWTQYVELRAGDVITDPGLLDRARALAAERRDDANLGLQVQELYASLAYKSGLHLTAPADRQRRIELLKEASDAYRRLIDQAGERRDVADSARMSLAAVEESLALAGEGQVDEARRLYQQLAESKTSPYRDTARKMLDEMDQRMARLQIVATRPAEATQPAPATRAASAPASLPATAPAAAGSPPLSPTHIPEPAPTSAPGT